jgi:hypothetical protein
VKLTEMFPRKYASGEDLQGRSVTVTIARVAPELMRPGPGSPEVTKYVLYSVEGKKGIVLSRTLAGQIAQALGSDDTDNWTGQRITLYPETVSVAGAARVAMRARAAAPAPAPQPNGAK